MRFKKILHSPTSTNHSLNARSPLIQTIPGVAHLKKRVANLSASVRQRLLNLATERKEDFGLVVTRYGLERFLYRLSISPHCDSFVLKGALLLQLWTAETYRPTRDLDLLGRGISNVSYRKIFSEVCSQKVEDDGLTFLPDTIRVERIRDDEAYEG